MTRKEEAIEWFREELKDGKCSDTCVQCNANEVALRYLEMADEVAREIRGLSRVIWEYGESVKECFDKIKKRLEEMEEWN